VQVLEGPEAAVRALYACIRQAPRHSHVVTVSEGPGPGRRFGAWGRGLRARGRPGRGARLRHGARPGPRARQSPG
jgi:hypothetical protein